jgi:anti-sigma B factor antagonist
MMSDFDVTWRRTPAYVLVTVSGEVDMDTAPQLERILLAAAGHASRTTPLVLDLSSVGFLGSAGVNAMITCHQRCAADGTSFVAAAPRGAVARVLRITAVDTVLTVVAELPGIPVNPP